MPPMNWERRHALADAAIEILGRCGVHGLSHRTVDQQAALPAGTTSNYFRTREALLAVAAERVLTLHQAEMEAAHHEVSVRPIDREQLIDLLAASLTTAATEHRTRYLAVFGLSLEATRRPGLQEALAAISRASVDFTLRQHRLLGVDTSPEDVQVLIALYGGALFTLVTTPPEQVDRSTARALAAAVVNGVRTHPS